MIVVKNRELVIPNTEYNLGTNYDGNTMERVFQIDRVTPDGVDISNLSFSLDLQYYDGVTDTAGLVKVVTDEYILLTLTVVNTMLSVPGPVIVQIRALDGSKMVRWTSFKGSFFVEDDINPPTYAHDLSELEYWETRHEVWQSAENARKEAEKAREATDAEREAAVERFEADRALFDWYIAEAQQAAIEAGENLEESALNANLAKEYAEGVIHVTAPDFYLNIIDMHLYETNPGVNVSFSMTEGKHLKFEYTTGEG